MSKWMLGLVLGCVAWMAQAQTVVTLDSTLRPNQDLRMTARSSGTLTMTMTMTPSQPTAVSAITTSELDTRVKTSAPKAGGQFDFEMTFERWHSTRRLVGADESEGSQPGPAPGMRIKGIVEKSGAVRKGSVRAEGADAPTQASLLPMLVTVMERFGSGVRLRVQASRPTRYQIDMPIAIPNAGSVRAKLSCDVRLIDVVDRIANLSNDCTMGLRMDNAPTPMNVTGRATGGMRYDTVKKLLLGNDFLMDMKFKIDSPEIKMDIDMLMRQTQATDDLINR